MQTQNVEATLGRLRAAADAAFGGFPATTWRRTAGPGPETLRLNGGGGFEGLSLEPGCDLTVECTLDLPADSHGVPLAGDGLEAIVFSIFPTRLSYDGKCVFDADHAPVASGPALVQFTDAIPAQPGGTLEMHVTVPNNQLTPWLQMRLTTPGLRARFELLDVAWARLALARTLAATPADRDTVLRAAAAVPETLPTDAGELSAALDGVAAILKPFEVRAAATRVHLVGHSHIDMNWLWTWPDTVEVILRDFRSVLKLMDEFPDLCFSHSQPATYEVVREKEPALFEKVLGHISTGRWEPISMTWVEGDVNMASGEGMARQLLQGVTYTRDVLGAQPTTFHSPDTFGHAGNLPQLAASAGAARYYHHRANPGSEDLWPAYWWQGQDGSRLLAMSTPSYNGEIQARDLAEAAIRAYRHGQPVAMHFHGIGDHGGGPSRQNLQALRRFQGMAGLPTAFCGTTATYARELLESGVALPEHRGESRTIFEGCYTTHADTKRYNRDGENLLTTADTLAAVAGIDHSAPLRDAWRTVLFNQFHDIFDGSAIHEVYDKNREDFEGAAEAAAAATEAALQVLQAGAAAGTIAVTNPLGWEREDWVCVPGAVPDGGATAVRLVSDQGHSSVGQYGPEGLGFVARAPAFGTVAYTVKPLEAGAERTIEAVSAYSATDGRPPAPEAPYLRVETPVFRALVRKDCGVLCSLVDKRVNRELVSFGIRRASDYMDTARPDLALNVFQIVDEKPHGMTAWQVQEVHSETSLIGGAESTVIEAGPARCVVEVKHTVRSSRIVQRIIFYRDLQRIDFVADVDWREIGDGDKGVPNLKASFTARLPECNAWFETPFAAVRRPADGQEAPLLRWSDVGGDTYGIALLNDGKYGGDTLGCRLRLSLLRSAYDPDAISDVGQHTIRYSLLPHAGDWREAGVVQSAAGFNQPLLARVVGDSASEAAATGIRPHLPAGSPVVISALKRSEDGSGVVVRLYESAGRTVTVRLAGIPAGARVWETSVVEDRICGVEQRDGAVGLTFGPWQVKTLLVEPAEQA